MKVVPVSTFGKWSLYFILAMVILIIVGTLSVNLYEVDPGTGLMGDLINRPLVGFPNVSGVLCGLVAFVLGLLAIIKNKDRSLLVFVPTVLGGLIFIFLIGELIGAE
ncbi:MAG: hypothetical protein HY565_02660 [Candidatus Kerfeldbacteria bacterium]|nr:hypothetical protein [Candidatus Kerfeldbacteria bacterium]